MESAYFLVSFDVRKKEITYAIKAYIMPKLNKMMYRYTDCLNYKLTNCLSNNIMQ